MKRLEISFICEELNLNEETVIRWIRRRLIDPADHSGPYFDEEDFSRMRFLADLEELFEADDASLELILHLVDQIHSLQSTIRKLEE